MAKYSKFVKGYYMTIRNGKVYIYPACFSSGYYKHFGTDREKYIERFIDFKNSIAFNKNRIYSYISDEQFKSIDTDDYFETFMDDDDEKNDASIHYYFYTANVNQLKKSFV